MLSYMYEIVMCVDTILMAMTFCSVTLENEFFHNHAHSLSS